MQAKHTPGPWIVGPRGAAVYGPDNMRLASLDANAKTLGQRTDNARLIAAAPDLLAALKALLEDSMYVSDADSCECGEDGNGNNGTCCHIQAHRAIKKALGK